jgi:4-amino-4-deoxy-L-arabinose transferase-like glycosyltransferase
LDKTLSPQTNGLTLKKQLFYIVLIAAHIAAFFWVMDMPFLGDTLPSNLYAANNIYAHNFSTIWNTPEADPGHPTLYPLIIAIGWVILGKSLWVTHLIQILVGLLLCLVTYKIAQQFWSEKTAQFSALIFAISPFYVAQLTNASLQLPLTLAALSAFYFWLKNKNTAYIITISVMMLLHLQGAFLLLFLAVNDVVFYSFTNGIRSIFSWIKQKWWQYTIPFLVLILWAFAHYQQFGWAISSPNYLRDAPTLKGIAYNFAIAFWRITDFGYVIPLFVVLLIFFKKRKTFYPTDSFIKVFISYSLLLLLVGGGICVLFAYPPIHRYFLPASVFLIILFAGSLEIMRPIPKKIWAVLTGLTLVAGNFMYYPGKCIGDSNIAYLPIYELEQEIKNDFGDSITFYTYAPLSYPTSIRYLDSTKGVHLKGLYNKPFDSVAYIFHSNMNCEFSFDGLQQLKGWHGTTYEKNGIYINIYANPAFIVKKPEGWQLRQPSNIELWMKDIKKKFK